MKNKIIFGTLILMFACMLMPGAIRVNAADIKDALYTDGFEKVSFYNKYAVDDSSLVNSKIWIEGNAQRYDEESNSIIVHTEKGDWAAYCGENGTSNYKALVQEAIGKEVRVFGKYAGVSPSLQLPQVDFIQKATIEAAYRLETTDNDYRISYLDYIIESIDLDQDNTFEGMTYKESSAFKKTDDGKTVYYYLENDAPCFIMVHAEDLGADALKNISEDVILDTFAEYYTKSTDHLIRKEKATIGGEKGVFIESSFIDDDMPCSMSLFSYVTVVNDHCYYLGSTQPYLTSETLKRTIAAMLQNISFSKVEEEKIEAPATSAKGSVSGSSEITDDTEGAESTFLPTGDEKQIPTKADIIGLYSLTVEVIQGSGDTKKDTGDVYLGEKDITNYDETTGVCTMEGDGFVMVLTFEYDKDKRIMCHGSMTSGDNVGSIIGLKTS